MIVASLVLILGAVTLLVLGLAGGSSVLLVLSIAASLFAAVALVVGARQAAAARAQASYTDDELFPRAGDEDDSRVFHHRSTVRGNEPGRRRATAWVADETSVAVADPVAPPSVPNQGTYRSGDGTQYGRRRAAAATVDEPGGLVDDRTGQHDQGFADLRAGATPQAQGWPGQQQQVPPQQTYAAPDLTDDDDDDDDEDPPDEPAAQFVSAADAARVARMPAPVLVIDGRPRYHISGCVHLLGRESEPLPVSEAADLGFTPCSLCEPDSALLAGARRV